MSGPNELSQGTNERSQGTVALLQGTNAQSQGTNALSKDTGAHSNRTNAPSNYSPALMSDPLIPVLHRNQRSSSSRRTAVSVFSSRYLTMTGV